MGRYKYSKSEYKRITKCPPEKVYNPFTGRCVLKNGPVGKKLLEEPRFLRDIKILKVVRLTRRDVLYGRNKKYRAFRFLTPCIMQETLDRQGKGQLIFDASSITLNQWRTFSSEASRAHYP